MQLIDTHVHLMMPDYPDVGAVLTRAQAVGVTQCVVPGIDLVTSKQAIALSEQYPHIVPAIGLHPMQAAEDLAQFNQLAQLPQVKAIGEIGTDIRVEDVKEQEKRLRYFLELAIEVNKPVLIHVIRSWDLTLKILNDYPQLKHKAVIHCFSGEQEEANELKRLDILLSVTAILARSGMQKTREVIKTWPLESMMLETDGPWLNWPKEDGPNEPKTVRKIAELVAEIKGVTVEEVAQKTTQTAKTFFDLG